ncbi:MAG: proton-conducting transporter membrane subunit [Planctomycetia bacterium]|nr:proton-conducting transporter membrane subunit [Planctomycetia bacterium]
MRELHFPWIEVAILIPLIGAILVGRLRDPDVARKWSVAISGLALFCAVGEWLDFDFIGASEAEDHWHLMTRLCGRELFVIDELSAPLIPLVSLLYFLTMTATLRTKIRRFSFAWTLISETLVLALFSCQIPWGVIGLLAAGTIPPYLELRARGKPTRVYLFHMALFIGLMILGWAFAENEGNQQVHTLWAIVPLLTAVLIRSGIAPFHCWMTDLFEHATFGTALLFATPIAGAYAAVRLVLPIAPDWVLQSIGLLSLLTAVYAAGMALIQREARRFFCYLFLSHSALVLVGLEMVTPIGLTGALCVWLSSCLALSGFGLTLRALESRCGRLSLTNFQGHYEHTPNLAMCFVLTGLASVGFPGTFGFVGTELLVDGAVEAYPHVGVAVVLAAALNGIAVVQTYFRLFTGTRYVSSVSLQIREGERYSVLGLAALILIGGLCPQPNIASRHHAAHELLNKRQSLSGDVRPAEVEHESPVPMTE